MLLGASVSLAKAGRADDAFEALKRALELDAPFGAGGAADAARGETGLAALCARAADAVVGDGCFDLSLFRSNRHALPALAVRVREAAKNFAKFPISHLLAVCVDSGTGDGSIRVARVTALLYDPATGAAAAVVRYELKTGVAEAKGKMSDLGSEIYRRLEEALKKG